MGVEAGIGRQPGRVLLIAAHPDDETIGVGIRMTRWDPEQVTILHITDGSPRSYPGREEYAKARRQELSEALALAGIGEHRCRRLHFVDQEAYLHLPELVEQIGEIIDEIRPDVVYTHPYEGGHPDHDSAAFAVAQILPAREYACYHAGPAGLVTGEFLGTGEVELTILSEAERDLKRRMFQCFRTQQPVLRDFQVTSEKFRDAPRYDFTQPPHPGQLQYEKLGWNITGEMWRARAAEALQMLPMRTVL